jgi:hypothetical protein
LIRAEVERQSHKEEKPHRGEFAKHPAVLLILTFLLTTLLGSVVTSWWQYQQWARQQAPRRIRGTKSASLITMTAQSVAESCRCRGCPAPVRIHGYTRVTWSLKDSRYWIAGAGVG